MYFLIHLLPPPAPIYTLLDTSCCFWFFLRLHKYVWPFRVIKYNPLRLSIDPLIDTINSFNLTFAITFFLSSISGGCETPLFFRFRLFPVSVRHRSSFVFVYFRCLGDTASSFVFVYFRCLWDTASPSLVLSFFFFLNLKSKIYNLCQRQNIHYSLFIIHSRFSRQIP